MSNENRFEYTYSAPTENERREIESIKKQYVPTQEKEDKLEKLRKLNKRVIQPPMIIGSATGVIGTLVFGLGMAMVLEWGIIVWGVMVGIIGAAFMAVAYSVYCLILRQKKKKYGKQIVELSNELLNKIEK